MKCFCCGKQYLTNDEDAGTYKEAYCSLECESSVETLIDLATNNLTNGEADATCVRRTNRFMITVDIACELIKDKYEYYFVKSPERVEQTPVLISCTTMSLAEADFPLVIYLIKTLNTVYVESYEFGFSTIQMFIEHVHQGNINSWQEFESYCVDSYKNSRLTIVEPDNGNTVAG